jgi:hypothetical protein
MIVRLLQASTALVLLAATTAHAGTGTAATTDPRYWQRGRSAPPAAAATRSAASVALTVSVRDRAGAAPDTDHAGYALAFDLATGDLSVVTLTDGEGTAEVAPGSYLVQAFVETAEAGGVVSLSMPMRTAVRVAGATRTTLDARGTARIGVSVDRPGARLAGGTVQVNLPTAGARIWYAADFDYPGGLYVQPTGTVPGLALDVYGAVTGGEHLYNLTFRSAGAIPRRPVYVARTRDLAAVTVRLAGQDRPGCARIGVRGRLPDRSVGFGFTVSPGAVPGDYPDLLYFTPGADPQWQLAAEVAPAGCTGDGDYFLLAGQRFHTAGRRTVTFGRAPLGPGLPADLTAASRTGNALWIQVPMYADAGTRRGGGTAVPMWDYPGVTGHTELTTVTGKPLGRSDRTGFLSVEAGPEDTRYLLTTESTRDASWSNLSTAQRTTWGFRSAAGAAPVALPLLAVRYDIPLDDLNRAPAGVPAALTVHAEQNGVPGAPDITSLSVRTSFDDGATWRPVALDRRGDRWRGTIDHPAGAGYVSLRAAATDAAGNTVEQETIRAYAVQD